MNEADKFGDKCPICGTKWKITKFGARTWKDCLECEDTAENLTAKNKAKYKSNTFYGTQLGMDYMEGFPPFPSDYNMPTVTTDDDTDDDDWFI